MRARSGLLGALLALLALRAVAAESRIVVPEGCGTEAEWRSELERWVGAPAASAPAVDLEIVRVGSSPVTFELRLGVGAERRVLRDPVCRVLWRSALVIVAAASRTEPEPAPSPQSPPAAPVTPPASAGASALPTASSAPAERSPTPSATPPSSALPASEPAAPLTARPVVPVARSAATPRVASAGASPAPRSRGAGRATRSPDARTPASPSRSTRAGRDASRIGVGLGVGLSSGVVPGWGPQLEASVQLEALPWAVAFSMRHWPTRGQSRDGRSVLVSATGGRAAVLFWAAPALNLLAGLELNRLAGEGSESVPGRSADVAWQLAPVLGLNMITMDIGYLRLELGALARIPWVRPRFVVTGFGTLYRAPVVGADAMIRGVLAFW